MINMPASMTWPKLVTAAVRRDSGYIQEPCIVEQGLLGTAVPVFTRGVVMVQLLGCVIPTELQLCPQDPCLVRLERHAPTLHTIDPCSHSQAQTCMTIALSSSSGALPAALTCSAL